MPEKTPPKRSPWLTVIVILLGLTLVSLLFAGIAGSFISAPQLGNVAVISVTGPITVERGGWTDGGSASRDITKLLKDAEEDSGIDAILIDINSPGGSPVASDEIGQAIKNSSKPTVALIHEVGASGGYWVASVADHIIANRMSVTGSIGVIGSYLEFPDLLTRYNVTYRRLISGKYKDMGTPFRELSPEEQQLYQSVLDQLRDEFINEVAANRHLPREKVDELATGQIYLGKQALELGLVDELGGQPEAIAWIESQINTTAELVPFEPERGLLDILAGIVNRQSFSMGEGIGSALANHAEQNTLPQLR